MRGKDATSTFFIWLLSFPINQLTTTIKYPNTTYPDAVSPDPLVAAGTVENQTSPPYYPSPWGKGSGGWAQAYGKAQAFVSQLTLVEKVNLTTGVG